MEKAVEASFKDVKFDIEGGKAIVSGKAEVKHELVEVEIPVVIRVSTSPIVDKVIDVIEQTIPGDQVALAEVLKVKVKELLEKV